MALKGRGGDPATRGLSQAFGGIYLPVVVGAVALFCAGRNDALQWTALFLLLLPWLAVGALFAHSRIAATRGRRLSGWAAFAQRDPSYRALHGAIVGGDPERLRRCLSVGGFKLDGSGVEGETALGFALRTGRTQAAEILVEAGADPLQAAIGEESPLVVAAGRDEFASVLGAMLRKGADPNQCSERWPAPLLFEALKQNARRNVGLLLEAGARVDVSNQEGRSALVQATLLGLWVEALKMVELGAPLVDSGRYDGLWQVLRRTHPPPRDSVERVAYERFRTALRERGME